MTHEISRATSNRRLLALAAFLRTVPRKRFDYGRWVGSDWKGAQDLSCGTTACALGWAATMPQFRRLGLILRDGEKFGDGFYVGLKSDPQAYSGEAAMQVFGLDDVEVDKIFFPRDVIEETATPKQVAKKIERYVKNRGNDE
jgi:hypothetical protein